MGLEFVEPEALEAELLEAEVLETELLEAEFLAPSPLRTLPHGSTDVLGPVSGVFLGASFSLANFSLNSSSTFCCGVFSGPKLCIKVCP